MTQTTIFHRIPLLSDLPKTERDYLASILSSVTLHSGEILFKEGDPGECLYAVLEGQLEVLLGYHTPDEQSLAKLGSGEFIGEMSLLIPDRRRTATVRATMPTKLWKMTRADFDALMIRQPQLAFSMVQTLTKRLDASNNSSFRELQEKNRQLQLAYDRVKRCARENSRKRTPGEGITIGCGNSSQYSADGASGFTGISLGAYMQPARMVGGDFYDLFLLESGGLGVVIGDVADKGIPSAIFMARTHALIMAEATHGGTPGEILRRANDHLMQMQQSSLFVTVLFGIVDLQSNLFSYARAGHELPFLVPATGDVKIWPMAPGQPLGLFDDFQLDEGDVTLPKGSTLLFYSDGVTDCCNKNGIEFNHQMITDFLDEQRRQAGQVICNLLAESLKEYQDGAAQYDDITILTVSHLAQM